MPAVTYNFVIEVGSDFAIDFVYSDENGNPVDLTDKCVTFQFGYNSLEIGDCAKYILSTSANSNYDTENWSISADNNGIIKIKIAAELTKTFAGKSNANYDLDVISGTESNKLRSKRLARGVITFEQRNFDNLISCPSNLEICDEIYAPPTATPDPGGGGEPGVTVTPTPTADPTDLCDLPFDCYLDVYSIVYVGEGLDLEDISTASGCVYVDDTRTIENVEFAINGLRHQRVTDLQFILAPPSGDKILLSANHNISNYTNGFSFMFSNKAETATYLHNCSNGDNINIYNKTDIVNYNSENLLSSFDHLFGYAVTGNWCFYVRDTDPTATGTIDSWKLIVTYEADEE